VPTELPQTAVEHLYPVLMILGAVIVGVGGIVIGLWRGWQAVIGQIKSIIAEHEEKEDRWQRDISKRLIRLERSVGAIREHLIAADIIEVADQVQDDDLDTKP
jgi:uncharacterized protein Yka (UPF0111/DUF47 family)